MTTFYVLQQRLYVLQHAKLIFAPLVGLDARRPFLPPKLPPWSSQFLLQSSL